MVDRNDPPDQTDINGMADSAGTTGTFFSTSAGMSDGATGGTSQDTSGDGNAWEGDDHWGSAPQPVSRRAARIRTLQLRTRNALRGKGPPTHVIAARSRDVLMDDALAYEVIDLALRMGEAFLAVGVSASATTARVLRIAAAYGLTSCQVEVAFTSITLSVIRDDGEPVTSVRLVKVRTSDYTRLAELDELVTKLGPDLLPSQALERLDRILSEPHPYRRWIVSCALAGMAAAVAGLLGGGLLVAFVAGATTAAIDQLLRLLNRWALPSFFQHAAGAAVATSVAIGLYVVAPSLPVVAEELSPSLIVAAGITVLLAGLAFVGSAEDAISGFYLTASARIFEVVLLTTGIVVGLGGILALARRMEIAPRIHDVTSVSMPLALQALLVAAIAGFFGIASYARPSAVMVAAAASVATYGVFATFRGLELGVAPATALAAFALGLLADLAGSRTGIPSLIISTCGIAPLLPGFAIYRAMYVIVETSPQAGLGLLLDAIAIALALAAGVALGSFVALPLTSGFDRYDRTIRRKARSTRD